VGEYRFFFLQRIEIMLFHTLQRVKSGRKAGDRQTCRETDKCFVETAGPEWRETDKCFVETAGPGWRKTE
jgi:hypothetical protein